MTVWSLTDRDLARRLERAEAAGNRAFVEARARSAPESGALWREIGGTWAMFDGVGSPITQTFGLGLFAPASDGGLAALEAFFRERGADVDHEVSPLADPALLTLLPERGYRPLELSTVLHCPVGAVERRVPPSADVRVRPVEPGEEARWAETAAGGWGETPEAASFIRAFGLVSAHSRGSVCFAAECEGEWIATGSVVMHEGVALLAGASTLPAWRRRGAQGALLAARLAYAAAHGCDLAMMAALPGSTSQLNAERQGFRVAYTRMKWRLAAGAP